MKTIIIVLEHLKEYRWSFMEKSNQWDFTNTNTIRLSVQSISPHDNTCFANQYSI